MAKGQIFALPKSEAKVTTLRYALIGMAALAALEFYAMMIGGGTANG